MGDAQPPVDVQSGGASRKIRVRTPGKHIVLFALAATFMLAASTAVIRRTGLALADQASADGVLQETFLVDLSPDEGGRLRLLKMTVEIRADNTLALRAINSRRALIRERMSFFLRELSPEDFDGSPARDRLKIELLRRINLSLGTEQASDVIVSTLIIQ